MVKIKNIEIEIFGFPDHEFAFADQYKAIIIPKEMVHRYSWGKKQEIVS